MSKLKQDIEDSLIELVDERYTVDVKNNITKYPNGEEDIFSITIRTPFFSGEDINKIEDYLHQCYDFMEMNNYNVFKVTINRNGNHKVFQNIFTHFRFRLHFFLTVVTRRNDGKEKHQDDLMFYSFHREIKEGNHDITRKTS